MDVESKEPDTNDNQTPPTKSENRAKRARVNTAGKDRFIYPNTPSAQWAQQAQESVEDNKDEISQSVLHSMYKDLRELETKLLNDQGKIEEAKLLW